MRYTWISVILFFGCSTKHPENSSVSSKITYDSVIFGECAYDNLLKEFNIRTKYTRYIIKGAVQDSSIINLYLSDRTTHKVVDSIRITSSFLLEGAFMNCDNVMSYSTNFNINKEVVDNYYGDIVIADLNFDNKDDIAVTNDSGGNGGTFYSYFMQTERNTFILDKFLTDSMTYFPTKLNKGERSLVTYVHAGACGVGENVYQLDRTTNHWVSKSHKVINVCDK